jgi:hypothetical protein
MFMRESRWPYISLVDVFRPIAKFKIIPWITTKLDPVLSLNIITTHKNDPNRRLKAPFETVAPTRIPNFRSKGPNENHIGLGQIFGRCCEQALINWLSKGGLVVRGIPII